MVSQSVALPDHREAAAIPAPPGHAEGEALDVVRTSRVAHNFLVVLASQVAVWIAGSGIAILLPRYLGDADMGRLTFALSFTTMAQLLVLFGSERYLTREIARDPAQTSHLVFNALISRVPLFLLSVLGVYGFMLVFNYRGATRDVVWVFMLMTAVTSVGNTVAAALMGLERMTLMSVSTIIERVISGALGLAAIVLAGQGLVVYAFILLLASSASTGVLTVYLVRLRGLSWRFDRRTSWRLMTGGFPFFIWGVSLLVYGQIDITILSVITNDEVVGWYGTAYRFISVASFVPFALTTALFPSISSTNLIESRAMIRRALDVVMLISIPTAVFFMVAASAIIDFLGYREDYANSIILLRILSIHIPMVGFSMIGGMLLVACNREGARTKAAIAAAIIAPLLNLAMIPWFQSMTDNGAIGASIASVLIEILMGTIIFILLDRRLFGRSNAVVVARCLAAAAPMAGVMVLLQPAGLPAMAAAGALTYLAGAFAFRAITPPEAAELASMLVRRGREAPA